MCIILTAELMNMQDKCKHAFTSWRCFSASDRKSKASGPLLSGHPAGTTAGTTAMAGAPLTSTAAFVGARPVRPADANHQLSSQQQTAGRSTPFSEGTAGPVAASLVITQQQAAVLFDENKAYEYTGAEAGGSGDSTGGVGSGGTGDVNLARLLISSQSSTRRTVARCSSHNSRLSWPTAVPPAVAVAEEIAPHPPRLPILQSGTLISLSGTTTGSSRLQRGRSVDHDEIDGDAAALGLLASPRSSAMVSATLSSASGSTGRQYSGSTGGRVTLSGRTSIPSYLLEGFGSVVPLRQASGDDELTAAELQAGRASVGVRVSPAPRESFSLYTREPAVLSSWASTGGGMAGRGLGRAAAEPTAVRHDILLKLMAEPPDEVGLYI